MSEVRSKDGTTIAYGRSGHGPALVLVERFARIRVPVLVLSGSKTDRRLKGAARAVAEAVPGARHAELAGQSHNVSPDALAPAAAQFLGPGTELLGAAAARS